jgi:predicted Zn-dependent protease
VAKLAPDNVTNCFLWAQMAIKAQDFKSAEEALATIDDKTKHTADYHKIKGALAWNLGQASEAEHQYVAALQLEPNNQANILNLQTIRLASTNQVIANGARLALEQTVTNAALRPIALRHLITAVMARHDLTKAIGYSKEIVASSSVNFTDKINHLQLLREIKSSDYTPWLASLKTAAAHSSADAFALGRWMASAENPDTALHWLHELPSEVQTNQPVPLIITDCQIALKDWNGLLAFTSKQDWGGAEFYRQMVQSLGQRSLGQTMASENAWRKALHLAAKRLAFLSQLAQVTSTWGWIPERTQVLRQITDDFPKEKWALNQLMAQFYAEGNTSELQKLLGKSLVADPTDNRLKNNFANILLLRKSELDRAGTMAKEAYDTSPDNPFFISTYAYSLSLQKKTDAALKILDNLKPEYLKIPSIAAYYGVIQAKSGHQDLAREYIARAEAAQLLPEEKELIRQAKAQL